MTENALVLAGFFVFVTAMVTVAGYLYIRRQTPEANAAELVGRIGFEEDTKTSMRSVLLHLFQTLGEMMPSSDASRQIMQQRLNYAGYRRQTSITVYFGAKCASGILLAVAFCILALHTRDDGSMVFAALVCGLGLGFLLPERVLDARIAARNEKLRRGLPPAIDLLVMGLEAGQGLDQALMLAARGLHNFAPELGAELQTAHLETRASKSRAESVRHVWARNSEVELRKFCNVLLDSDRFGSSLAPTLRQHAKYLRVRFRQSAQETARKLTVKMVFPVFFLIFPTILVVTLGPAVLMMSKYFKDFMK